MRIARSSSLLVPARIARIGLLSGHYETHLAQMPPWTRSRPAAGRSALGRVAVEAYAVVAWVGLGVVEIPTQDVARYAVGEGSTLPQERVGEVEAPRALRRLEDADVT